MTGGPAMHSSLSFRGSVGLVSLSHIVSLCIRRESVRKIHQADHSDQRIMMGGMRLAPPEDQPVWRRRVLTCAGPPFVDHDWRDLLLRSLA